MPKQLKINKFFWVNGKSNTDIVSDDAEAIEYRQLIQQLERKRDELQKLQKNTFIKTVRPPEHSRKQEQFVRPIKIILNSSISTIEQNLELMSMLTSIEVQSYEADSHCSIVYHLQHDSNYEVKHGLLIDLKSQNNVLAKSSLPIGFNLDAVLTDFKNVMSPDCLCAIRMGLVAYYERLEQYEALKKLVNIEAQLFKMLDGSYIEITFKVYSTLHDIEDIIDVKLSLKYRVYDIRPKQISLNDEEINIEVTEALYAQCAIFKKLPLDLAFKKAFMNKNGSYTLLQHMADQPFASVGRHPRRHKRFKSKMHQRNDDTFRPEECSSDENADTE